MQRFGKTTVNKKNVEMILWYFLSRSTEYVSNIRCVALLYFQIMHQQFSCKPFRKAILLQILLLIGLGKTAFFAEEYYQPYKTCLAPPLKKGGTLSLYFALLNIASAVEECDARMLNG